MKNLLKRYIHVVLLTLLIGAFPHISLSAQNNSSDTTQQSLLSHSGEIRGTVGFCGDQGNDGTIVGLVGRSFMVQTDASGKFFFSYVPFGDHNLRIKVPGYPYETYVVNVDKNQITDLGLIEICPDNDNDGYTVDLDCNDNNPLIYPYANEECDGVDNDCDDDVDEGCVLCTDGDGDGFPAQLDCPTPKDCDDTDNMIFPGATEICDARDNDCDGDIDEHLDADLDGFTSCGGDCDDSDNTIYPDATEECDGVDNNCDQNIDENFDQDGDGFTICNNDCNDDDNSINPDISEVCDGLDNDCSGTIDDPYIAGGSILYDGGPYYSDQGKSLGESCGVGECAGGVVTCDAGGTGLTCNTLGVASIEQCGDGIDNDCNGQTDEGCVGDNDGDGFGADADCDDTNARIYPGAPELCDGLDNSCSGSMSSEEYDNDADLYVECTIDVLGWNGANPIVGGNDCDDTDAYVYPNATEICADGIDNDCNGQTDEGCVGSNDGDGDGFGADADCDDTDARIYPGAPELCDGLDNSCSGSIDDGNPGGGPQCNTGLFGVCNIGSLMCVGGTLQCTQTFPPSDEICDALDNDCDGLSDEGGVCISDDIYEPNDTSVSRAMLGSLNQGQTRIFNNLTMNDNSDWYGFNAIEGSSTCFPGTSQTYSLVIGVTFRNSSGNLDLYVEINGTQHISNGSRDNENIIFNIDGRCGIDDGIDDIRVQVYSSTNNPSYSLSLSFIEH